jgi:GT2 family glycosyltransferase
MAAVAQEFPWAKLLRVEQNRGPSVGNNRGIERAGAGAGSVLLLNNDTTVAPDLIDRLIVAAEAHPEFQIIGPVINSHGRARGRHDRRRHVQSSGPQRLVRPQGGAARRIGHARHHAGRHRQRLLHADFGQVFRTIGVFDEQFFIYHDEADFCLRALESAFRCGVMSEQLVWHKGSSTFKATGKRFARYYDSRNLVYLLKKHDGARLNGRTRRGDGRDLLQAFYFRIVTSARTAIPMRRTQSSRVCSMVWPAVRGSSRSAGG